MNTHRSASEQSPRDPTDPAAASCGPGVRTVRHAVRAMVALQLVWLVGSPLAGAAESGADYAVVIQGAHLIQPNDDASGYHRVAYLPVGTIVKRKGETRRIGVDGRPRRFSSVVSQSGVSGFLSNHLFQDIEANQIAVPVASTPLLLFREPYPESDIEDILDALDSGAQKPCDERCIVFSRSDGVYLEILDREINDYYAVILHRSMIAVDGGPDLEKREDLYLQKISVNFGQVRLIDIESVATAMTSWTAEAEPKPVLEPEIVATLLEKAKDAGLSIGESTILCNSHSDTTGEVGVDLFFVKGGISGGIATKKEGEYQTTTPYVWERNGQPVRYELERDMECDNSVPSNTRRLVLRGRMATM